MIHVNCPICGKKLAEGTEGSNVSIQCGKCKHIIIARINHGELVTSYTANEPDGFHGEPHSKDTTYICKDNLKSFTNSQENISKKIIRKYLTN